MSAQDVAMQAAELIQTAHINKRPDPKHDLAPATAADKKVSVKLDQDAAEDALSDVDDAEEDEIPVSLLQPTPRRPAMPPLPDLRFEQSYLASIKDAKDWQAVSVITLRDQVIMPLVQGLAWTLIVAGWRHWNTATKFKGQTVGARIRRWWWDVNNWTLPAANTNTSARLREARRSVRDGNKIADFYHGTANAGSD